MKKIFIYYSLTGNGDVIAEYLKNKKIDVRKVDTLEKIPNNRILQIMIGGYKALINYKDKLDSFDNNIDKYDEVIIGSPIWNSRLSSPINSVLDNLDLNNKKVTFIFYSGSGTSKNASELVNKLYKDVRIINIKEPKKNNDLKELEVL